MNENVATTEMTGKSMTYKYHVNETSKPTGARFCFFPKWRDHGVIDIQSQNL